MTQDEIIEMAIQAGLPKEWISDTGVLKWSDLEAFAKLVAAKEREECAKVCDAHVGIWIIPAGPKECAAAIRARGQRTPEGGEA
jgi:hypothetical protein